VRTRLVFYRGEGKDDDGRFPKEEAPKRLRMKTCTTKLCKGPAPGKFLSMLGPSNIQTVVSRSPRKKEDDE